MLEFLVAWYLGQLSEDQYKTGVNNLSFIQVKFWFYHQLTICVS